MLKKVAGGAMVWGNDDAGVSGTGTQYRIPMWNSDTTLANSVMNQDGGLNSITLLASSMTIQGTGGDGLGVTGAVKLGGAVSILGANTFTVGTGLTTLGGALNVTGVSTLTDALTVHNYAQFGSGVTKSTFTTGGNLNMTSNGDIVLLGANAQITLPNAPVDGTDAANKNYVDTSPNAGPWDKSGINVRLDTITDIVGVGIDSPLAKLHVSSNNAAAADYLFIVSSGPLAANNRLTIKVDGQTNLSGTLGVTGDVDLDAKLNVDGTSTFVSSVTAKSNMGIAGTLGVTGAAALSDNLTVNGNTTLGNAATDWIVAKSSTTIDIAGGAVDNTSALTVKGTDSSGIYAAKFYSGANLAAWIKKK
ncbi:MAG: hypothetical protein HY796_00730 [Elusimicrobia bacterium]|nr:hypothetical protein [Elusimicrobiota bacterium]